MGDGYYYRYAVVLTVVLALMLPSRAAAENAITFTATAQSSTLTDVNYEAAAHTFINHLQQLENTYNPALASLYAPQAIIQLHRTNGDEGYYTEIIPGQDYQRLLAQGMSIARAAKEHQQYHIVSVTPETMNRVLVVAHRKDITRGVTKPIAWRLQSVGPQTYPWQIVQEIAEL